MQTNEQEQKRNEHENKEVPFSKGLKKNVVLFADNHIS